MDLHCILDQSLNSSWSSFASRSQSSQAQGLESESRYNPGVFPVWFHHSYFSCSFSLCSVLPAHLDTCTPGEHHWVSVILFIYKVCCCCVCMPEISASLLHFSHTVWNVENTLTFTQNALSVAQNALNALIHTKCSEINMTKWQNALTFTQTADKLTEIVLILPKKCSHIYTNWSQIFTENALISELKCNKMTECSHIYTNCSHITKKCSHNHIVNSLTSQLNKMLSHS